jgi:hypothetical protein
MEMTNKQSESDVTGEATPRPPDQLWMSYDPELDVWFQSSAPPNCYRDEDITEPPTFYVRSDEHDQLIAQRDALVKVKARHDEYARARNFASCGCDYCEALREGA